LECDKAAAAAAITAGVEVTGASAGAAATAAAVAAAVASASAVSVTGTEIVNFPQNRPNDRERNSSSPEVLMPETGPLASTELGFESAPDDFEGDFGLAGFDVSPSTIGSSSSSSDSKLALSSNTCQMKIPSNKVDSLLYLSQPGYAPDC